MSLIPQFSPGQRVLVTPRPNPEDSCPSCGFMRGENLADETDIATVIAHAPDLPEATFTCECGDVRPLNEGEYVLRGDRFSAGGYGEEEELVWLAPYTWIFPIDTESEVTS